MNRTLRATRMAHLLLNEFLNKGQTVIDATAGNGYDTLFLAQTVGKQGKVYAFDIQEQALQETKKLLEQRNCLEQVILIRDSHEKMDAYVEGSAAVIVYNLGYLPGGDKRITTTPKTTINSLKKGLELLAPGGIIQVTAYPGHPGGEEEARIVEEFLTALSCPPWHVLTYKRLNGTRSAPYLLLVHKEERLKEGTT